MNGERLQDARPRHPMTMHIRSRVCALLVMLLVTSCDDEVLSLQWSYAFEDEALAARAVVIEGQILRGGCDASEVVYQVELRVGEAPRGDPPPRLDAERFGFLIVARDASCIEFAAGCEEVDLADATSVLVTLSPVVETALCLPGECDDGDCGSSECSAEECNGVDDDCDGEVDEDFDLSVDSENCGACGEVCHASHAVARCVGGACEVASCESGWGDCSGGVADGCETPLNTLTDCGACDTPCAPTSANGDCSTNTCEVGLCDPGWGDCSGGVADGCETELNTLTDCGACDTPCAPANAIGDCSTATCEIVSCSPGWEDCSGGAADGCESALNTLTDCGACDTPCAPTNGRGDCSTGDCEFVGCDLGWGDCTGGTADGCETALNTLTSCGACDAPCTLPNAIGDCSTMTCEVDSCDPGWGDCSGGGADGCETDTEATHEHCGACGRACDPEEDCRGGLCCSPECDCEQTCGEGADCICEGGCECSLACVEDPCSAECRGEGTLCEVDAAELTSFGPFVCSDGATRVIDAAGSSNAEDIACTGAATSCDINCESGASCFVDCRNRAECLIRCAGRSTCEFEHCGGVERSCADDVIVCNRRCP